MTPALAAVVVLAVLSLLVALAAAREVVRLRPLAEKAAEVAAKAGQAADEAVRLTQAASVSARLLTLQHIAAQAAGVGEQLGSTPADKLQHAMSAARALDMADNQTRDFTDAELRIAIEAHLGRN